MAFDINDHLDVVTGMVEQASRRSLEWFRRPMDIDNKGTGRAESAAIDRFDPVTAADRAVEDELRRLLHERFPDHEVMGEEGGSSGAGDYRWVIDPIDGTRAFILGQPLWGTILGLQRGRDVVAGWLHQPSLGHTYVASPAGAWLHEGEHRRSLATSGVTELESAAVLCTHPAMFADADSWNRWLVIEDRARLTRFGGDCINYGYVASGLADVVIDNGLAPYDIIPVVPLIERAGGVVTGLEGQSPIDGGWAIAAATPELHHQVLDILHP